MPVQLRGASPVLLCVRTYGFYLSLLYCCRSLSVLVVRGQTPGNWKRGAASAQAPRCSRLPCQPQEGWALCSTLLVSWFGSEESTDRPLWAFFPSLTNQNYVGIRQFLPKVWPCWETRRTTRPCPGLCPSWRRSRTRWNSCIRSRQPVTSSFSRRCWQTTSACWEPWG